jgi:hypothetical protein
MGVRIDIIIAHALDVGVMPVTRLTSGFRLELATLTICNKSALGWEDGACPGLSVRAEGTFQTKSSERSSPGGRVC